MDFLPNWRHQEWTIPAASNRSAFMPFAMTLSWNSLGSSQRTARPGCSCRACMMLVMRLPRSGWARISAKLESGRHSM